MQYDLAIIGGGPAGAAAGVYASRKKIKTVFITKDFGGQSVVSPDIQNWIGTVSISGEDLARNLKEHVEAYAGDVLDVKDGLLVETVVKNDDETFTVKTNQEKEFVARTVLVTTGSHRRKLDVPGSDTFENKGITYCATCDGPMFGGQDVVVIGGGNAGFETAAQLLAYANSVTLLHRGDTYKADPITVEKVLQNPKMTGVTNAHTKEIKGDAFVEAVVYEDAETGETHEIKAGGVFVEIGLIPTTGFVKDLVDLTDYNQIKVNCKNQRTSMEGVWAAGDCTDGLYHQNNIAAGDAVKALEDIYMHLQRTS